jgi:antibiotic biosynthesis monooxygenase (ABM) superfamily enzyme
MAKHSSSILELARRGADHRYEELQQELASLVRQFPDLRRGALEIVKSGRRATRAAAAGLQPRRRRKMSAAARARISAAQRARWAKQKAVAAGQSQGVSKKAGKKR